MNAQIAQSVEQRTENPRVAGSIPALGTNYCKKTLKFSMSFFYIIENFIFYPFFIKQLSFIQ